MILDRYMDEMMQLKPLFAELVTSVKSFNNGNLVPFCMQWGADYPSAPNKGIMFYGRATNGWVTFDLNVDNLFDINNPDRIFARDDQMVWVDAAAGNTDGYNTNKSAFWRVIRHTASHFYPDNTLQHICWSNVCKIAPDGGNPSDSLFYAQLTVAKEIMSKEIEIFKPRHVVLLVGEGWAVDFLYFLNGNRHTSSIASYRWGNAQEYEIKVYKIGNTYFYRSEHPERKNEETHVKALIRAISDHD